MYFVCTYRPQRQTFQDLVGPRLCKIIIIIKFNLIEILCVEDIISVLLNYIVSHSGYFNKNCP